LKNTYKINCTTCLAAKLTTKISRDITIKARNYLDKIVLDLCRPITPYTLGGNKYILFILDSATRYLDFYLLKSKSEAFNCFKLFKIKVEKQSNNTIKAIKTDLGGEFNNTTFNNYLKENGIIQQFSSPRTPEQNSLIERVNRTILETTRCLLYNSNYPYNLWGEAVAASVYIYNISKHSSIDKIPLNLVYPTITVNYKLIKIWGSIVYYKDKNQIKKLEPRGKLGILIGYTSYNSYKVLDIETSKTFIRI